MAASFLKPDQGRVLVDGRDLSSVTLQSYRSRLGVVLQDDFLYEGTIRENILFGRPQASEEEVLEAVRASHVKEFTDHFEQGLETLIGERGVKLSGGQRQRVSIARALLADPRILILDEATSNLDTESELYIQQSLAGLMRGRTTFVIAHRLSTIRQAHQILVVEAGEIVERGDHEELIPAAGPLLPTLHLPGANLMGTIGAHARNRGADRHPHGRGWSCGTGASRILIEMTDSFRKARSNLYLASGIRLVVGIASIQAAPIPAFPRYSGSSVGCWWGLPPSSFSWGTGV